MLPDNILKCMSPELRKVAAPGQRTREEAERVCDARVERELQRQVANLLRQRGIPFCQQRMDKKSNVALGWPDFVFAVNGIPIAVECKTQTGKLSYEQERMRNSMVDHGWNYFVVRNLAALQAVLDVGAKHKGITCKLQ